MNSIQTDLFSASSKPIAFEVNYRAPSYPDHCFPGRCQHPPQFSVAAEVRLVDAKGGGKTIEIDHAVCLGCGVPTACTHGGNILVDLCMIIQSEAGQHRKIGQRANALRERWARIASYLFGETGWNGRHKNIARLIDPMLTMTFAADRVDHITRMGKITFDPSYLRSGGAK